MVEDLFELEFVENLLEDSMPFTVMLSSEAKKALHQKGNLKTQIDGPLEVYKQMHSGDIAGFICWLRTPGEQEGDIVISLTHLKIPRNHPYHHDLCRHQKRRIKYLKREHSFRPQMIDTNA